MTPLAHIADARERYTDEVFAGWAQGVLDTLAGVSELHPALEAAMGGVDRWMT